MEEKKLAQALELLQKALALLAEVNGGTKEKQTGTLLFKRKGVTAAQFKAITAAAKGGTGNECLQARKRALASQI